MRIYISASADYSDNRYSKKIIVKIIHFIIFAIVTHVRRNHKAINHKLQLFF
jgi:hypothetical protein